MRAPLSWIREFTPVDAPVADIVAGLNQLGLEVDALEQSGEEIIGVRAARILEIAPVPKKDRVRFATVDLGDGVTQVVCGAPNIEVGMVVPLAAAGAELPGGFKLTRKDFGRGVVSDGMLCSARELGLGEDHSGILALADDTELGSDVRDVLGLNDIIFELAITPNRPDAMGITGVARELAAYFKLPLTIPEPSPVTDAAVANDATVVIEAEDRCPRFVARTAEVTMGSSPDWMQQRLIKAGMRPISNVVDVTNYVMLEMSRPVHAFDLDRLAGGGIVVRTARDGETMTTLDDVERELTAEDLLICDAERAPQAIAGIMGGADAEVSDATTRILLEVAHFERMGIARTSKRLKLRSEASARFERGVDPDSPPAGAARVMELLEHVASARVSPSVLDLNPAPFVRPRITLRTSKVNGVLGTKLSDQEVLDALSPLGIDVSGSGDAIEAVPPSFRPDLDREIDLVEEVARRVGFDRIGRTVPKADKQVGGLSRSQRERRAVADTLVGAGCSEAITLALQSEDTLRALGWDGPIVGTLNALRAEESALRPLLFPGLLNALGTNFALGNRDVALFEIGRVFWEPSAGDLLPVERVHVAALMMGSIKRSPVEADRPVDVYDARDLWQTVADAVELGEVTLEPAGPFPPAFHPTRTAIIRVDGEPVGQVGEFSELARARFGIDGPVVGFEVNLESLFDAARRNREFRKLSRFPFSNIDLAFVMSDDVPAAEVVATLESAGGELVESVHVFDEYRDDRIGKGRRSLAFAMRFRALDRTLTDDEVAKIRQSCIDAVVGAHGAELRG
ncbi:MAG: phenylalanine--tRNA ligase subunit beta [Acidimicrobiia bacterium]